ncbi:hypothetical protein BC833DRAFT_529715 [Globomyces pollinis-pini]|nr:hypothetical protein BC833DRAFT_529715 [Globomyces pollinis-pini]
MTVDSLISFNREDFTNPDFISQDFIAKRKHLPVQQLTLDLNTFTKILSSELVELINNDYRDFISLSRNLIGVDTIISDLKTPLLKLNSKYFQVENELQASIDHLQEKLNDRLQLRQKKQILITYIRVNESIEKVEHLFDCLGECLVTIKEDPVTFIQYVKRVERVAIEYSQLDYLLAKGKSEPFISNQIWKAEKIKSELTVNLVNLIQVVYTEVSSSPINEDANQTLLQLLRIFVSLDTVSEATKTFEETILTPFFESQLPNEDNLDGLFEPILAFVRSRCMKIYEISTIAFKGIENNLLVDSIWTPIIQFISNEFKFIFNVVNPTVFHQSFKSSSKFISHFEKLCFTKDVLVKLRSNILYKEYNRRWQLSVYFQLKHNEFIAKFEEILSLDCDVEHPKKLGMYLDQSISLIETIESLWSDDVFLFPLGHRFWKSTLLLINRYISWINHLLPTDQEEKVEDSTPDPNLDLILALSVDTTKIISTFQNTIAAKLNLIDRSVSSPTALSPLSPISNISNGGVSMLDLMIQIQGILGSTLNLLPAIKLTHFIVDSLVQQCSQPFKNIANIPAQYRKTNKEVPKTASYFISSIFQPLKDFLDLRPLDDQIKSQWKGMVLDQISQKYSSQVIKTLQQVKTIEESLKRFSKKKKKVESNISDEDKIRTVFALDCKEFGVQVYVVFY